MQDFVFVQFGQENEFILEAKRLGFCSVVLVYSEKDVVCLTQEHVSFLRSFDFDVFIGVDLTKSKEYRFVDFYLQLGTRKNSLFPITTHLYGNELEQEKDFMHQRRSGLNQVILQECAQKQVSVLLGFGLLHNLRSDVKIKAIGRMMVNVQLCKKYGVLYSVVSLTSSHFGMRHVRDVLAFSNLM